MSDEPKRHAPKGRIKANLLDGDPMRPEDPISRPRCSAHSKQTGRPCKYPPIAGGTVCRFHGGAAPQVKAAAEARLDALVHPAITRLGEHIEDRKYPTVSIAAVKDVLDRRLGKAVENQSIDVTAKLIIEWQNGS